MVEELRIKFVIEWQIRVLVHFIWVVLVVSATAASGQESSSVEDNSWLRQQEWVRDQKTPILELGSNGEFDDTHLLTPLVALENGGYRMWYSGSQGAVEKRIFRVGLAESGDGLKFKKYKHNPIFEFGDGKRSIVTPTLLRDASGNLLRQKGKLRMWFIAVDLAGDKKHTLHESTSENGIHWSKPSASQMEDVYAPTIIKEGDRYQLWYVDVSAEKWVIRHAMSNNGQDWIVSKNVCIATDQAWEGGNLFYPTVLKADGKYLMWYGSYWKGHASKTALGFAISEDGIQWIKNPNNPVFTPNPENTWESHYTTSQSVMRMPDGSFRIWYSTRKAPPHVNKYFAMGTAHWAGPAYESEKPTCEEVETNKPLPAPEVKLAELLAWQKSKRAKLLEMLGVPKERVPLNPVSRGSFVHDGLVIEKWIIQSEPGSHIPCVLYRKQGIFAPMPGIVLTYGHGGSKSQPSYQYMAQVYAKLGFVVLAMDPLGEEERNAEGKLGTREHDQHSVDEEAWKAGRPIMGKLVWDTMRGVDFLRTRKDVDPKRLGVMGNSLGGALAGWLAVLEPRLSFSIVSGWAFDDMLITYGKPCTAEPNKRMRAMMTWQEYLVLAAPHCSMLIQNGTADTIIDKNGTGSTWRGNDRNAGLAEPYFAAHGTPEGIKTWYEQDGGHRPYPANVAAVEWLLPIVRPEGWEAVLQTKLHNTNFGNWTEKNHFRLEKLYGTNLHLVGASVADLQIKSLDKKSLACLKPEEVGTDEFSIQGWLRAVSRGQHKTD